MKRFKGIIRKGSRTKDLVRRCGPGSVAVLAHRDLDRLAAQSLIEKRVTAVVNTLPSISGRFPCRGALCLVEAGIPLLDILDANFWETAEEGQVLEFDGRERVVLADGWIFPAVVMTKERICEALRETEKDLHQVLHDFFVNTLQYAHKEKELLIGPLPPPPLRQSLKGKHVVVVVRGDNYRHDLRIILPYIREVRPVLIGVDGGADALLEVGLRPDLIVGDMDSVSDQALRVSRERIVHAYRDGRAPGLDRVRALGLTAATYSLPGTSEDVALLLAYEAGAELIVALGTHTHVLDFLEKGRPGMASSFLARLRIGGRFVDAKGVNQLYRETGVGRPVFWIMAAGSFALVAALLVTPLTRGLLTLAWLHIRLGLGW